MKRWMMLLVGCLVVTVAIGQMETASAQSAVGASKIAFQSDRDGNSEIYVMNTDGSDPVNLTNNPAWDGYPTWSPDGTRIAFTSNRSGTPEIYIMDIDGTNVKQVTDLQQMKEKYGQNPKYPGQHWASWSPNGEKVTFWSRHTGYEEIYIIDVDGSNLVRVTNNRARDFSHEWSPDGTQIAITSSRYYLGGYNVYVMNADGSNPVHLRHNASGPSWSPDGAKIIYYNWYTNNIHVMNADGTNDQQLTHAARSGPARSSAWSPDENKMVIWTNRDGNWEIYVMNADGSEPINLTKHGANDTYPAWSPILQPPNTLPVANAGSDQTDEDAIEATGALTTVALDGSGSSDPDGDNLTYTWSGPFGIVTGAEPIASLPLGTHTITLVVNDGDLSSEPDEVIVTVKDTTPPQITTPDDVTQEAIAPLTPVNTGSATASDLVDGDVAVTNNAAAVFPLGATPVTWTATDASGNIGSATQTVTVVDTTPPEIALNAIVTELWPPNHEMHLAASGIAAVDLCDPSPMLSIEVTSNEAADDKGDGDTEPDWEVIDNSDVLVRAERSGNGADRVYTIEVTATDASGSAASAIVTVTVPHDRGKGKGKGKKKEVVTLALPQGYALYANTPNPFNPETAIRFDIPMAGDVRLEVLDILGRRIRVLMEGGISAGRHQALWDGRDDSGQPVSSGVYLYRLQASEYHTVKRMLLIR